MFNTVLSFVTDPLHAVILALLLGALVFFIRQFVLPGLRVRQQLAAAHAAVSAAKRRGQVLDLDEVAGTAMGSDQLRHCWSEYRDTLHAQKRADEFGSLQVARWRATALAQGFFTEQALVDAPLRTEFYKHLPGMLTGLGIIGTFSGLILGLQGFQVTDDANQVRQSLATLIQSVGGAFILSGLAIVLAMLATLVEKAFINGLYTQVESLCGLIDSLFDAGAGEEYLQRLVEASETSATQALQMKESLVTDLKQVLTELTQQQIATMTATSQQLGQNIATSLSEGLKEPLERIGSAVQTVSNSQGEAVNKLLTDVLSSFATRMEGMFGGQLSGMNEMLAQTARTISAAAERFDQMAGEIQRAGAGASDAMAKRMDEALAQMQARQLEASEQMRSFIEQMRGDMARGQSETFERTAAMMKELADTTSALVRGLQEQAQDSQTDYAQRQLQATEQMRDFLKELTGILAAGQSASQEATRSLVEDLKSLSQSAQADQAERQLQATEQMRDFLRQMSESLSSSQAASAQATRSLVDDLRGLSAREQGEHAARQEQATAQMREFVDRIKADALEGRAATEAATSAMVADLKTQSDAAAQSHAQREQVLADQLRDFLGQMRDTVVSGQSELSGASAKLIQDLGAATQSLVEQLQSQAMQAERIHGERVGALAEQAAQLLARQSDQVAQLTAGVQSTVGAVRDAVSQITSATQAHLDKMSDGAERLGQASDRLVDNLGAMRTGTEGLTSSADRLREGADALSASLSTLQQALADHKQVRDGLANLIADLRQTVDNAKHEAGFTKELLDGLEVASQRLTDAQRQAETYLEGVSEVLGKAHAEFASNVQSTLRSSNAAFHEELASAVSYLKNAILDLGDILDRFPERA